MWICPVCVYLLLCLSHSLWIKSMRIKITHAVKWHNFTIYHDFMQIFIDLKCYYCFILFLDVSVSFKCTPFLHEASIHYHISYLWMITSLILLLEMRWSFEFYITFIFKFILQIGCLIIVIDNINLCIKSWYLFKGSFF